MNENVENQEQINKLNDILRGTYMGVDSYNKFLNNIDDMNMRHKLEEQELLYRNTISDLESCIRDLGGNPAEGYNLGTELMTKTMVGIKLMGEHKTLKSLQMIKDGINQSIVSKKGALDTITDKPTKEMLYKQIEEDKRVLSELDNYINQYN